MSFPEPYVGLVIRYAYLWKREFDAGREEGTKDRPCAIVMTVVDEDGDKEVLVLPVTHTPPADPADGIEIPAVTKSRLGLDGERSWIVITEANEFVWPGPDLRTVPGRDESTIAYGPLPPRFFGTFAAGPPTIRCVVSSIGVLGARLRRHDRASAA